MTADVLAELFILERSDKDRMNCFWTVLSVCEAPSSQVSAGYLRYVITLSSLRSAGCVCVCVCSSFLLDVRHCSLEYQRMPDKEDGYYA